MRQQGALLVCYLIFSLLWNHNEAGFRRIIFGGKQLFKFRCTFSSLQTLSGPALEVSRLALPGAFLVALHPWSGDMQVCIHILLSRVKAVLPLFL